LECHSPLSDGRRTRPGSRRLSAQSCDDFRKKFLALPASYTQPRGEKEFIEVWLALQNLKVFYEAATENLEAVAFTAKYQT
jgi:hypothetical protein